MKRTLLLAVLVWMTIVARAQESYPKTELVCYDGQASIFPASWLDKKTRARATAADTAKFRRDTVMLINALNKYPGNFVEKEVRHIYVVGQLSFNRQYFTGTNSREDVYIGSEGNNDIEKTFHHEFSSILLRNYGDERLAAAWRAASPELRGGNSASAVKAGLYSVDFAPGLLEKGYLSPYSLSNWENDFNMYAENIFAGGKAFWKIADSYPKVKAKVQLVINFYHSLWGGYSETFFRVGAGE